MTDELRKREPRSQRDLADRQAKMREHMARSNALRAAIDYRAEHKPAVTIQMKDESERVGDLLDLAKRFENYINTGSTAP